MQKHFLLVLVVGFSLLAICAPPISFASQIIPCAYLTQRLQCGNYACDAVKNICIPCREKSDCYPDRLECDTTTGQCVLPGLFSSFDFLTFVGLACGVLVCALGVVAGVGGGGILVPMFTGLLKVAMKTAVGMSQSTICGQSSLNVYFLVQKKHPDTAWERPLINYQYLSLLLPLGLIGAHIGGMLSKVSPDIVRLILLFGLLSGVLYRTVRQLRKQYAQDTSANSQEGVVITSPPEEASGESPKEAASVPATPIAPIPRPPLEQYPKSEILICFICFFALLACEIFQRISSCGGFLYWVFAVLPVVVLAYVFYTARKRLESMATLSPEVLTFVWNKRSSTYYPIIAVVAGAAAAMLGLGGGLVLGFVLYETLSPMEASATSGVATFFISFSAALPQIFSGILPLDYCLMLFIVGFGATALGHFVIMEYIKKKGYNFLIVGALATILLSSLIVLGGYGIYNATIVSRTGASLWSLGKLCSIPIDQDLWAGALWERKRN